MNCKQKRKQRNNIIKKVFEPVWVHKNKLNEKLEVNQIEWGVIDLWIVVVKEYEKVSGRTR